MRKQTLRNITFLLLAPFGLGLFLSFSKTANAANPTNINFQGKMVNADGTNVTNGTYSMVFRIYNTASPTMTTSCTSTATCLWQETQASVQVTNGVFQVELGAACALTSAACNNAAGGPINFGTNNALYLTMQFNGDTSGANGGFMSPTIHITSVPFAFNSDQLGGISASGFIQNTTSPQATSNFNISGTGIAGTALQAPSFDSATANGALGIGSTSAGAFTIGNVTNSTFLFRAKSQAAAYQLQNAGGNELLTIDTSGTEANNLVRFGKASTISGRIVFNNSTNANTVTIVSGVTSGSYSLTLPTALPGSTQCITSTSGGVLGFGTCSGGSSTLSSTYANGAGQADSTITLDSTRLGVIIQDAATPISGNLFTVQKNVGGAQSYFSVTTSAVTLQDTAGYNALVFDSTTSELKIYENVASPTNYARIYYASGEAVFAASSGTTRIGSGSGNITMSLTNPSDMFTFTHTGSLVAAYSSSDFTVTRNLTAGANAANGSVLKVEDLTTFSGGSSAPNVLLINQNNGSATGNLINAQLAASSKFLVNTAGTVSIAADQSYTGAGALNVQSAAATALTVTGNAASTWSTSAGNLTLQGGSALILDASSGSTITIGNTGSGNYAQFAATTRELAFFGSARHTRRITVTPEYAGGSITGDGTSNSGTMTSDNMTASPFRNYYNWASSGTADDYDIWVKVPIPSDFSEFSSANALTIEAFSSTLADTTIEIVNVYDAAGTSRCANVNIEPGTVNTWANATGTSCTDTGVATANDVWTLQLRLSSANNANARVGQFYFEYLSMW